MAIVREAKFDSCKSIDFGPFFESMKPFKTPHLDQESLELMLNAEPGTRFVLVGWDLEDRMEVRACVSLDSRFQPSELKRIENQDENLYDNMMRLLKKYEEAKIIPVIMDPSKPGNMHRELKEKYEKAEEKFSAYPAYGFSARKTEKGFSWTNRSGLNKKFVTPNPVGLGCHVFKLSLELSVLRKEVRDDCNAFSRSIPKMVFDPLVEGVSQQLFEAAVHDETVSKKDFAIIDCESYQRESFWEKFRLKASKEQMALLQELMMTHVFYAIHLLRSRDDPKRKKEILDAIENAFDALKPLTIDLDYIPELAQSSVNALQFAAIKRQPQMVQLLLDQGAIPNIACWKNKYDRLTTEIKKIFDDHFRIKKAFLELFPTADFTLFSKIESLALFLKKQSVAQLELAFKNLNERSEELTKTNQAPLLTKEEFFSLVQKKGSVEQKQWISAQITQQKMKTAIV
jgi:hypothetical protein